MSSSSISLTQFIDHINVYNADHSLPTDVSGIVIFDVTNDAGHSWDIAAVDVLYDVVDISDASVTNAYFLPYDSNINIVLNIPSGTSTDSLDFYVISESSMSSFSSPRVNISTLPSSVINTNVLYRIFENYMVTPIPANIDPIILTPPATLETYTTATLPIVSSYTPAQVNSVFNTRDEGYRVVETKSEQTIAAEVKSYLNTNGVLPQFKNYGDYLAYKNAINLQNSLLQRYG